MIHGIPTDIIIPHNTKKLHMMFVIDKSPSYFHINPIVDLALSTKPYPVMLIMIIV
jgi:hypothetical protein